MTVHGMVFNNITPPHKTPNNVGQVEYCYTQIHGTRKSRAGIELLKFPCPFEIIYRKQLVSNLVTSDVVQTFIIEVTRKHVGSSK